MYVSVFQMKTTDTEQISDTINLVDEYRLRTDDAVVWATCIRGVRAAAVCVISNKEYTRSISTARITANNIAVRTVRVCTSSLYIDPACIGPHIVETSKKIVPAENQSNIKADDRVSTNIWVLCLERLKVTLCYEYSVRLMYLPVIE